MNDPNIHIDPRNAATGLIVGCGLGVLAVILIFGRFVVGLLLPLLIIAGSAFAIAAVRSGGDRRPGAREAELTKLRDRIADLEERLEAAETVDAFEDRLALKEAKLRMEAAEGE